MSHNGKPGGAGRPHSRYLPSCITLLALALALTIAACGGTEPDLTSPPAQTLAPTATPTPLPAPPVGRDDLPGMVLGQSAVEAEFPGLQVNPQASGYRNNEAAAAASVDPDDRASDLAAQGRLDGYTLEFSDPAAFSSSATGIPIGATISVVLFVTPELAEVSLQRELDEIELFFGSEVAGITLKEFRRLDAPNLGSSAVAGRLTFKMEVLNADTTSSFVSWRRGPIVASLSVTALEGEVRSSALERLAMRIDERIEGVLTGKIIVVAPLLLPTANPSASPSPIPVRSVVALEEAARLEGFDLEAMAPKLGELPAAANLTAEGFLDQPGTISVYSREFTSEGAFMALGASRVVNFGTSVQLHVSESNAGAQVSLLEAFGAEQFGQALAMGFAGSRGATAESVAFDVLELPSIGDLRAGFLVEFEIAGQPFQGHFVYVAQGQILSQILLIGPNVLLEDTVGMARQMEARVRDNSPR